LIKVIKEDKLKLLSLRYPEILFIHKISKLDIRKEKTIKEMKWRY